MHGEFFYAGRYRRSDRVGYKKNGAEIEIPARFKSNIL